MLVLFFILSISTQYEVKFDIKFTVTWKGHS